MIDTTIRIFYQCGNTDSIDVDSISDDWATDEGLFIIRHDAEPILIANMNTITCIKVENLEAENFPKNKKGLIDSDLRVSASIMREEYRNNPDFRQSIVDSMLNVVRGIDYGTTDEEVVRKMADTIFDYETDSNN